MLPTMMPYPGLPPFYQQPGILPPEEGDDKAKGSLQAGRSEVRSFF